MKIKGTVALITGGGQGFGKAFSRELLKRGGKVAAVDINASKGAEFLEECQKEFGEDNVWFTQCDVTDPGKFEDAFEQTKSKFGGIDIVCNNAGGAFLDWSPLVDLNLKSVIHGTYLGIKHMSAENGGRGGAIVNVASLAGLHALTPQPTYTATKFGVVGFSQCFKSLVKKEKIRVNALCPFFSPTALVEEGIQRAPHMKSLVEKLGLVPIADVAKGFLHLVTDDTANGETLSVTNNGLEYVKTSHTHTAVEFPKSSL